MTIQLFAADGPIARSVADLELAYAALCRPDSTDPRWVPADDTPGGGPTTVAVTADPGREGVDPDVAAGVDRAAGALDDAGYRVVAVDPPDVLAARDLFRDLVATEISLLMMPTMTDLGSEGLLTYLADFLAIAPLLDHRAYAAALAQRFTLCAAWSTFLHKYPVILGPVATDLPFPVGFDIGGVDNVRAMLRAYRLTVAVNVMALPAVGVPVGFSPSGLPLGVQVIGGRFAERTCLAAACAIESAVGTGVRPTHAV